MFTKSLTAAALGALLIAAPVANAAVTINAGSAGQTFTIDYTGQVEGAPAPAVSASQLFTVLTADAAMGLYVFQVDTSNTSTVASRLRSFGLNVTSPGSFTASATGTYGIVGLGDNFPEGAGVREVCFRATGGSNCTGGPNGLTAGMSTTGTITFAFAGPQSSITLDDFVTRFQSIEPAQNGGTSGIGLPVTGIVPEPATWAMMILGFGMIGGALRSRKAQATRVTYA
jgi:hypothetical protein